MRRSSSRSSKSRCFPLKIGPGTRYPNTLQATVKRAGIDPAGVHLHCLRRTFCSHLNKAGVNIKTAQALMGHSKIDLTLSVYTDPALFDKAGAVEALPTSGGDPERTRKPSGRRRPRGQS